VNALSIGLFRLIDQGFAGCMTLRLHDGQTRGTQVHKPGQFTWSGPGVGRVHTAWMWWQALAWDVASVFQLEEL
jgi:hypothetical protein